jgi:hypothetical protein
MPSPFPGMDPYLEHSWHFPGFHHRLISEIQAYLNRRLRPKYVACVEERVYISDDDDPGRRQIIPDVEVRHVGGDAILRQPAIEESSVGVEVAEPIIAVTLIDNEIHDAYLSVVDVATKRVVTVIEVLSPTNKCRGSTGRGLYLKKRLDVLSSETHLVEIDLLREGASTFNRNQLPPHHYAVHVSKTEMRPDGKLWPILLRQRLPIIEIPLKSSDPDALLDLQAVFNESYERGSFDLLVDYRKPPSPPLPEDIHDWAVALVAK